LLGSFFADRPKTSKGIGGVEEEKGGEGRAIVISGGADSLEGFVLENVQ
jgi:hypothetical protein